MMKVVKFCFFLILIFNTSFSYSNHLAGGFFEYSYQGNNLYEIDYYFLRDCSGVLAENPHLYIKNDCGLSCEDLGEMYQVGNSDVIDYGCGNTCLFGFGRPGYRLLHFQKTIALNSVCDSWTLNVSILARNEVDYIETGNGEMYYNYCKINNAVENNSPDISGNPVVLGCVGWNAETLYSIAPTDGDSIVYDFVPSKAMNLAPNHCDSYDVTYSSGLSANQSFPSLAPFNLNQTNGSFNFRATMTGRSYFAVRTREYRNGILIGETMVDGMIYVENCMGANDVTFHSFQSSGSNIMNIPAEPGNYCEIVKITSNGNIDEIVVDAPPFITWSVNNVSSDEASITICVNTNGMEFTCEPKSWNFIVNAHSANSSDCFSDAYGFPDKGYYTVYKQPGAYCPENLFFTNRNAQSGIPMPLYAHAEQRIWVGDSMPAIAPLNIQNDEGFVEVNGDLTLEAGVEIIIPSCKTGPCVTLNGNQTFIIKPNSCRSDCNQIPLNVTVHQVFDCYHEDLWAEVSGEGPYTYKWIIKGDTIISDWYELQVHDYVWQDSTGLIPYSCEVFDANGNSGVYEGQILGTHNFYKPIQESTIWIDYEGTFWDDGYYYSGQPGVDIHRPFFIADSVNAFAPWYGATHIECTIWDRWGAGQGVVYYYDRNLEGGEDWSFDNGEIWWNGYWPGNGVCIAGAVDVVPYILTARNCYSAGVHIENSALLVFQCYDGPWNPDVAKSMDDNDSYYQKLTGATRFMDRDTLTQQQSSNELFCYPNPAETSLTVKSTVLPLSLVIIVDQAGKEMLHKTLSDLEVELDISNLSAGMYTIVAKTTDDQEKRLKLVKR